MVASIEFMHELVDRFTKATAANLATKTRKGCLVQLGQEDADDVLVSGDLHGNRRNFNALLNLANLDKFPRRHLVMHEVVHGGPTYPNGGCQSHMLLEDIAKLKVRYPDRFHFLMCNHELSESTGYQMVKGGISQNQHFALGMEHAYGGAAARISQCYHEFIQSCPLAIRLKNGVFISHSIPDASALKKFDIRLFARQLQLPDMTQGGAAYAIVWGRDYSPTNAKQFADLVRCSVLITGHQPAPDGYAIPNDYQLVLDNAGANCWCCLVPTGKAMTIDSLKRNLRNAVQ